MDSIVVNANTSALSPFASQTTHIVQEMMYVVLVVSMMDEGDGNRFQTPCTGTLIRNDLVLTSTNCLLQDDEETHDPTAIRVHNRLNEVLNAFRIILSPNLGKKENVDLALIEIEESKLIKQFPSLPTDDFKFYSWHNTCYLGGYGGGKEPTTLSFQLHTISKAQVAACDHLWERSDRLCLHFDHLLPCRGDVGSPIVCSGVLMGLYNPMRNQIRAQCVDIYTTLFSPIYPAVSWVRQVDVSLHTFQLSWLNNPIYVVLLCALVLAVIGGIYYGVVYFAEKRYSFIVAQERMGSQDRQSRDIRF